MAPNSRVQIFRSCISLATLVVLLVIMFYVINMSQPQPLLSSLPVPLSANLNLPKQVTNSRKGFSEHSKANHTVSSIVNHPRLSKSHQDSDLNDSNCLPIRVLILVNWIDVTSHGYQTETCHVPCLLTKSTNKSTFNEVDAAVIQLKHYSGKASQSLNRYKVNSSKVLKVGFSAESTKYYPHEFDHLSEYDISMTFRMDSDVPYAYFKYNKYMDLPDMHMADSTWERREKAVVFVSRNCQFTSHREQLVKMLQKHVRVDSVSDCLRNKQWPSDIPRGDKITLLRRYVVYLAAENSIEEDYISEKVYDGLFAGAVPVYYGAPNIQEFVPSDSILRAPYPLSEEGISRLAEQIKLVLNSKEEYDRLTSWKKGLKNPDNKFLARFNFTQVDFKCRLCQKIASLKCNKTGAITD